MISRTVIKNAGRVPAPTAMTRPLAWLFAVAVGIIVLPLFASQPLVELIGASFGTSEASASSIPTTTMAGYAAGLILVVPLVDLLENRRVIAATLAAGIVALVSAAFAPSPALLVVSCFVSGVATSAIQMLVPFAASITPVSSRGAVIGNIMSGLMIGVLLSRPIASLTAAAFGWRFVYVIDALLIIPAAAVLWRVLPTRKPIEPSCYGTLISSLAALLKTERSLRRRATYQALCMAAFGAFWTTIALRLSQPPFFLGQTGIAAFALVGVGGMIVAPIAGRLGDLGWSGPATLAAHLAAIAALALAGVSGAGWLGFDLAAQPNLALGLLATAAVLLDVGVIADQTIGRRTVNLLRVEARGRMNGLYTGLFFIGSAVGAASAGAAWSNGGWSLTCGLGIAFVLAAFILALVTESKVVSYQGRLILPREASDR